MTVDILPDEVPYILLVHTLVHTPVIGVVVMGWRTEVVVSQTK